MPSHNDISGVRLDMVQLATQIRFGVATQVLGGNFTIDAEAPTLQVFDPAGARDITLPAEADSKGLFFIIFNAADAAEDITMKDDSPATVGTISQNEIGLLFCDGTTWRICVGKTT